jgi:hypothetical protein
MTTMLRIILAVTMLLIASSMRRRGIIRPSSGVVGRLLRSRGASGFE